MAKGVYQRFKFDVFSLSNFMDPGLVNSVFDILDALPDNLRPRRYGPHEPVEHIYDRTRRSELVTAWLNGECVQDDYWPRSGVLCLESGTRSKAEYLVSWGKSVAPRFNLVGGSATFTGDSPNGGLRDFVDMATALVVATDAVFGLIDREVPETNNLLSLIDLKVRLPNPCWVMFFGAPYVALFGRDKFHSAPCQEVVELPSGHFRLTLTSSPFEPVSEQTKTQIRDHFGPMAFTEPGRAIRVQKVGVVPSFDFHHVLSLGPTQG